MGLIVREGIIHIYGLYIRVHAYVHVIFLGSTKLKTVWKKITTFFKRRVSIILRSFLTDF